MMLESKPMSDSMPNHAFLLSGGDGEQRIFRMPLVLEETSADWFGGEVLRGPAMLCIVRSDFMKGTYFAFTSHMTTSIEDQLSRGNFASVVVHQILRPFPGFDGSGKHASAIGMAALERVWLEGP